MRVLILGTGVCGSVVASVLAKEPEVTELILADVNLEIARRLADRLRSDKVSTQRVDATKFDEVLRAAKGVDVVFNGVGFPPSDLTDEGMGIHIQINRNAQDAALKSGAHFVTMTSLRTEEQLEQSAKWKDAGLSAILGAGAAPGITNWLALEAADQLDLVDEVRIRVFFETKSKEGIFYDWWPVGTWMVFGREATVYENGEFKIYPPLSREEVYPFPEPIGPRTVRSVWHPEPKQVFDVIGKGKKLKYVDFKEGGANAEIGLALLQLGLLSDKPVDVKGVKVAPWDVLVAVTPRSLSMDEIESKIKAGIITEGCTCLAVEVQGEKAGVRTKCTLYVSVVLPDLAEKFPGMTGVSCATGVSAAVCARMLGKGEVPPGIVDSGYLGPDVRKAVLAGIAEKGIAVHKKVETLYKKK